MSFDTGDQVTDSDSHDVPDHTFDQPSPASSDDANHDSHIAQDDTHQSASEQSSDDNASDDGDFDMEESLPSQNEDAAEDHASSTDSNQTSKRKAPVEEDEFIKANPELYGLRRSVRCEKFSPSTCSYLLTIMQTRPREQRKIVGHHLRSALNVQLTHCHRLSLMTPTQSPLSIVVQ